MSEFSLILVLQKKTRESDDRHGKDTNYLCTSQVDQDIKAVCAEYLYL